jgi:hypothetical protein
LHKKPDIPQRNTCVFLSETTVFLQNTKYMVYGLVWFGFMVLLVEETGGRRENHQPIASH